MISYYILLLICANDRILHFQLQQVDRRKDHAVAFQHVHLEIFKETSGKHLIYHYEASHELKQEI